MTAPHWDDRTGRLVCIRYRLRCGGRVAITAEARSDA